MRPQADRKFRSLFVTTWFPEPRDWLVGNFIERHFDALFTRGHTVRVVHVTIRKSHVLPRIYRRAVGNAKVWVCEIPLWLRNNRLLAYWLCRRILRQLRADDGFVPEIVHGHVMLEACLLTTEMKRAARVPLVFTEHWSGWLPFGINRQTEELRQNARRAARFTDVIMPVSHDLQYELTQLGIVSEFAVIDNAVDEEVYTYQPRPENEVFTFVHISSFIRNKNVPGLLAAFADLRTEVPVRLVVAGDGDMDGLRKMVEVHSAYPGEVELGGAMDYKGVAGRLQQGDCFVLFSLTENLPCVIAEAHCCGLPVITSRVGGTAEMIDSENGLLVESEDVEALTAAMKAMCENPARYNRAQIAWQARARYGYTAVAQKMEAVYKRALQIGAAR